MSASSFSGSTIDLDDAAALLAADHDGVLRNASMAGAQVRATAAAVAEGALDSVCGDRSGYPPRTLVWVSGRGTAATAGAMLSAALGDTAAEPVVLAADAPAWIGALDVLVVAGDDPGDPALVSAAATGVRRGARVVVAAPYEGPLRDSTAGRVAVLEPRVGVPDEFGLPRYLAVGLAVSAAINPGDSGLQDSPGSQTGLAELSDELDGEALRNSAGREVFTNPAKALADSIFGCSAVALAGDCAATLALARHGSAALLRIGHTAVAATGLADAVAASRAQPTGLAGAAEDIFHDDQIDGPAADRLRVVALMLAAERTVVVARVAGLRNVDLVGAGDVPADANRLDATDGPAGLLPPPGRVEQQLAVLAVRLEMTAAYLRLLRG